MSTLVGGPAPQLPIPRSPEVKQFLYENAVIGETRRFRQLDRYEAFYIGRQYAHQEQDWWGLPADNMETISPEIQVPLGFTQPAMALNVRQKRPTAPYNLTKAVVDRFTGLLFSDTRRPTISVEGDPDTEDFLLTAMEQMRFWPKMREGRTMGGALGSVLVTAHLRDGKFSMESHNPKHVQIVWKDRRTLLPMGVLKAYKYPVEEDIVDERTGFITGTKTVNYLYRRIITEDDDTVFTPVRLDPGMTSVKWDVESAVEHKLGMFPGVWIQNLPVLETADGDPDCASCWQNFDTMDRILAQMNKAVLLNLDPTLVLGVDPKVVDLQGGVRKGSDSSLYVGQGGSATYAEISGGGVKAGADVYALLKQNTLDVVRCVLVDPQTISGAAQSAKAIEYIYAPMLEKADDLRSQYGDLGVVPLLRIIEAMARKFSGQSVKLPPDQTTGQERIGRYQFDLPPRITTEAPPPGSPPDAKPTRTATPRKLGQGGYISLKWGPYFSPTETDKQAAVANITAAKAGGLIDQETAVKEAAPLFDVRDADAMLTKIKQEAEAQQQQGGFGGFGGEEAAGLPWDEGEELPEEPAGGEVGPPAGEGGKP